MQQARIPFFPAAFTLFLAVFFGASPASGGEEEGAGAQKTLLQRRIERSVEKAVEWFRETQNRKGKGTEGAWSFREPYWESGVTSLVLFAMLRAGVDPGDPMIRAGFQYLADNVEPEGRTSEMYTYNVATQMLAIEEAFSEMLRSGKPKDRLEASLKAIFEANLAYCKEALKDGEAGYTIDQTGLDLSNTQFLVMGLEAANRAGYGVDPARWLEILEKGMALQAKDGPEVMRVHILSRKADEVDKYGYVIKERYGWITGKPARARGWTYSEMFQKEQTYGSMTCAGLANLLSCYLVLEKNETFQRKHREVFERAVRDGFAWLQKYYAVAANPAEPKFWSMGRRYDGDTFWTYYYLFTLARITTATNIRFIGHRNWFAEGADFLLKAQQPDGSWDQKAHETHNFKSDCIPFVNTAFALWFFSSLTFEKEEGKTTAKAAREEGKEPGKDFLKRTLRLLEDVHEEAGHWDVGRPVDVTADVLCALSVHAGCKDFRDKACVENAGRYLMSSIIPDRTVMERALKNVREENAAEEMYAKHLLFERWRTGTLCRQLITCVARAMDEEDWGTLAKGARNPRVAGSAKRPVALLVRHLLAHGEKRGRKKLGWSDSCGRPTTLQPDARNTATVLRALHAASLCGVNKPSTVWEAAGNFLLDTQEEEGPETELLGPDGTPAGKKARARGFAPLPGDLPDPATTLDVLAALHLVRRHGTFRGKEKEKLDRAVEDGLAWLQRRLQGFESFEDLVRIKRLGVLLERDVVGTIPWKKEGLKFIGYQHVHRAYLGPFCARHIANTLYFLAGRFLV